MAQRGDFIKRDLFAPLLLRLVFRESARAQFFDGLTLGGQRGEFLLPGVSNGSQRFALVLRAFDLVRYLVGPLPGSQAFVEGGVWSERAHRPPALFFHVRDARVRLENAALRERENALGVLLGTQPQVQHGLKAENEVHEL